jgi:hypothetical protein
VKSTEEPEHTDVPEPDAIVKETVWLTEAVAVTALV